VEVGDFVDVGVRRFVMDEFDVPSELPPGWKLLGVELVVRGRSVRRPDSRVEREPSTGQGAQ
jgi:hypothetical protein